MPSEKDILFSHFEDAFYS